MAKKKVGVNFILTIVTLATAVLSFVSLFFNFIVVKNTVGSLSQSKNLSLVDWFDNMNSKQEINDNAQSVGVENVYDLTGWNLARVFLVITLILVGVLAVISVVKFFMSKKDLNLATMVIGGLCGISALIFAIATFVGCGALSGDMFGVEYSYIASVGVYLLTICAIATGVLAAVASRKK